MTSQPAKTRSSARLLAKRRDVTRSLVLDAAQEVFADKGYIAATIDDVATVAGCSRATFYLHFPNKSTVLMGLADRQWPDVLEATQRLDRMVADGMDYAGLRAYWDKQLAEVLRWSGGFIALHVALFVDPAVATWMNDLEERASEALELHLRKFPESERLRVRRRFKINGRMTLAAYTLAASDEQGLLRPDVVDQVTELWAEFFSIRR